MAAIRGHFARVFNQVKVGNGQHVCDIHAGLFRILHLLVQSTCTDINSQKHSQVPFIKSRCFSGFHTFLHLFTIHCGHCGSSNTATHGAPTTPPGRRVISMFDVFYLIGYWHICHQCQKTFMNYDPNTIAKMSL